jgi:predicted phage terminase large subunit-like protein
VSRAQGRQVLAGEVAQHITPTDVELLLAEKCRRDFHWFFRMVAWPALNPGVSYRDNWHIGAIAEHLTAVHTGQIKRLIINMPFRMLKTTLCSVAFPAWEWLDLPHLHFLTSSYAIKLSTRDAVDSRRIIESPFYQRNYGHRFHLVGDQNEKTRYENDHRGQRVVTSTDSAGTGFGGNRIIVDDPISARDAWSDSAIAAGIDWWKGTGVTRLNDPENDAIIVVHQRLAEGDLTGHLLETQPDKWDQLVLPMRFEAEHRTTTSIGWTDPRTREGELLHADRLGDSAVDTIETTMGPHHTAAQLQQRPNKGGGKMFKVEKIGVIAPEAVPNTGIRWVRGWDFAASSDEKKKSTQAYTAGVRVGYVDATKRWIIAGSVRERFEPEQVEQLIVQTTRADGHGVEVDIPQDPGQAGKSQAVYLVKQLQGYSVSYSPESGDKAVRAMPFSAQVNAGNVDVVAGPWVQAYLDELRGFPGAAIKDQVDATSRAFNRIVGIDSNTSFADYVRRQVEELEARQEAERVSREQMADSGAANTNFFAFAAGR